MSPIFTSRQSPASTRRSALLPATVFSLILLSPLGCKSTSSDAALTQAVNAQLTADSSLAGQPIQASVLGGVVKLSGAVLNDAQRTIAARDAAGIKGVKEVDNNLTIASAQASAPAPAPLPLTKPSASTAVIPAEPKPRPEPARQPAREPAPIQREQAYNPPPPPQPAPRTPPPPAAPTYKTLTVPAGASIPVRVTQTLDSATTQQGDNFSGVVASDIVVDGLIAIPAGSAVTGNVDEVHEAAHFKGSALLTVSLTGIRDRGERLPLSSDPYTVSGKGRGKNTAEKAGGGAAVGAILGGIFGGGKGAAIGAGVGGAGGAGINAVTRGQQVQIPSESVVRFHSASAMTVRVRTDAVSRGDSPDQDLQHRPE